MRPSFMILLILALASSGPTIALADELPLEVELGSGRMADYGTIHVTQDGDGLVFDVQLDPMVVGSRADLHRLYFNLPEPTNALSIETLDGASKPYALLRGKPILGGAGSFFDWSVDFGAGAGAKKGNGILHHARFRISGSHGPLEVEDIMPMSATRTGVSIQMATHLQGASLDGDDVSTVGGMFAPDPPPASSGDTPPDGDSMPEPDEGCSWVIDLMTGEPLYQTCG